MRRNSRQDVIPLCRRKGFEHPEGAIREFVLKKRE